MKRYGLFLLLIAGAIVAVAAAAQDADDDIDSEIISEEIRPDAPPPEPACFNVRDIRNFDAIGSQFLWVQGRRDDNFLLTVDRACFGLRNAEEIGISNPTNRVCANSQAKVTFVDLGQVEDCVITTIEKVADKQAAETIAERRRQQD